MNVVGPAQKTKEIEMKRLLLMIIINCALCIVNCPIAQAEKLCVVAGISNSNYSYNTNRSYNDVGDNGSDSRGWAVGSGCNNGTFTGALASACGGAAIIAGVAGCAPSAHNDYFSFSDIGAPHCHCKRTHVKGVKNAGAWIYLNNQSSDCATNCASSCGNYARYSSRAAFRAALLAVPVP